MIGQIVQAPQVAQHHFQRDIVADGDQVEVHQRTDRILAVGHGGAQLFALLHRQRLEHVVHDVVGQVRRQVGELVGVERLGRGDQLLRLHVRDEGLAHRLGDFQQDLAIAIGLDQVPHAQALG